MSKYAIAADTEVLPMLDTLAYEDAAGLVGTKSMPMIDRSLGVKFHMDGIGIEWAPTAPYRSVEVMVEAEWNTRRLLEEMIGAPVRGVNVVDLRLFDIHPATTPRLHESVHTFGCSPDFKRGRQRIVPDVIKQSTFRELGTHFHINLPSDYWNNPAMCAGPAHEIMQETHPYYTQHLGEVPSDAPPLYYRSPGVYRATSYGIEYRSFGSSLIDNRDLYTRVATIMWDVMVSAFKSNERSIHI